jgi:hypothetical protein
MTHQIMGTVVKAGAIADADVTGTPADGTLGANTTTGQLLVRSGGQWLKAGGSQQLFVAASTAPQILKSSADYICDGIADEVEINAAHAALSAAGGIVQLSCGDFAVATSVAPTAKSWLRGQGVGTRLVGADTAQADGAEAVVKVVGPSVTLQNLTSDLNIGDTVANVTNGSLFVAGDPIYLESATATDGSWTTRVKSVATNAVTLESPSPVRLPTANTARCGNAKNWLADVRISDLAITCAWSTLARQRLLYVNNAQGIRVERAAVSFSGGEGVASSCGIQTQAAYGVTVKDCDADGILKDASAVAIRFSNTTDANAVDNRVRNSSSGISFEECPGAFAEGNRLRGSSTSGGRGIKALSGSHGARVIANHITGYTNATYTGVQVDDSIGVKILDNEITDIASSAVALSSATTDAVVTGNRINRACLSAPATTGVIHVSTGAGGAALGLHLVADNTIMNTGSGSSASPIILACSANTITGNVIDGGVVGIQTVIAGTGGNLIQSNILRNLSSRAMNTTTGAGANRIGGNVWTTSLPAYHAQDLVEQGGGFSTLTYSASMTPDPTISETVKFTATNATAMTVNPPTNCARGMRLKLIVANGSGGAMGAITWAAGFTLTGGAFVNPANTKYRWIHFELDDAGNWVEFARAGADI